MASPVRLVRMGPPRTGKRRQAYQEVEDEQEEQHPIEEEEEEPAPRRGRRPGKEPVEEDYEAEAEQQRAKKGRRSEGGPGSHIRSGRPPRVKPDPDGPGAGAAAGAGRRRAGALLPQAGPSGGRLEETGPIAVPRQELVALENTMAEYKRVAEGAQQKFKGGLSRQETENLVRQVMRHMLFLHSEKPGTPVSRAELTKLISGATTQKKHNMSGLVIALAQSKMLEVFGLEMRELTKAPTRGANKAAAAAAAAAGEGTKYMVLRTAVPPSLLTAAVQDRREDALRGFAAVLVAIIELSGGKITGAELWPLLQELGVSEADPHPRFGKPAELLEALTRRRYVNMERQQGPDGEIRIYTIAENAADEIGGENLKAFYESEFNREGSEGEGADAGGAVGGTSGDRAGGSRAGGAAAAEAE